MGGTVGAILIGLFGTVAIGGKNGLFYGGNATLLAHQALAVVSVAAYSLVVWALIALAIKHTFGLRDPFLLQRRKPVDYPDRSEVRTPRTVVALRTVAKGNG